MPPSSSRASSTRSFALPISPARPAAAAESTASVLNGASSSSSATSGSSAGMAARASQQEGVRKIGKGKARATVEDGEADERGSVKSGEERARALDGIEGDGGSSSSSVGSGCSVEGAPDGLDRAEERQTPEVEPPEGGGAATALPPDGSHRSVDGADEREGGAASAGGSEEDEASEDGSDDEDEDEDDEPTLKYARLGGGTLDLFAKDTASAVAVCSKYTILGTHNGAVFVLTPEGQLVKRYRPHSAMINALSIDSTCEFVASASMDGRVAIQSLTTPEAHIFDMQRPMRCVAVEPLYGKRNTRQFAHGGMAGNLVLSEKGWLGQKDVTLFSGEGPIWAVQWRGTFIAWASDAGVRIYDTATSQRITYISRAEDSPRADLFKCSLHWRDDRTLLIAWADVIKVAVVKEREGRRAVPGLPSASELFVEVTAIFQLDCMISGIALYGTDGDLLVLAYPLEEDSDDSDAATPPMRKAGARPELRIISRDGEELSNDAISLRNYERFQCRDYCLAPAADGKSFLVVSPEDIVVAQPRDESDHIIWLIEMQRYEEALHALEKSGLETVGGFDVTDVGKRYLEFLVDEGQYDKAAETCPKILGINAKLWEDWVFLFADKGRLETIIPYVPTHDPQLGRLVYEMILAHFLRHDQEALLRTIQAWPHDIYNVSAVILAIKGQLERSPKSRVLMQSVAELYVMSRQPGKALPYFLQLQEPHVFTLIRDHNLFTDIQDQALQLIEFDQELRRQNNKDEALQADSPHGTAIELLVDHTHSIPIPRVIAQLQDQRRFLFMYLDALFDKDPHLAFDYSDLQVDLYAEYNQAKLMDFLRASNYYSLERAYKICDARDLVPEMVFLLGRMGDNKRALNLIIERLGDVQRAIEFAKEQNDNDLWEDLLRYSETKPRFIRGLLENVGAEIDPIRLIRRIQNGLEIPGLKPALIKILQDFNLQISLMEGCKTVLYSDCRSLALSLHSSQTNGFLWTGETKDTATSEPVFPHLSGRAVPPALPFGVRFLSGSTYTGTSAFPSLASAAGDDSLSLAVIAPLTKRDQLVAASLLASLHDDDDEDGADGRVAAQREMKEKVAAVEELRARLLEERERSRRRGAAVRVDV
ncbi:Vacuolar protein sorting-associated protein 41 [Rhodotorula kratochvilovae]